MTEAKREPRAQGTPRSGLLERAAEIAAASARGDRELARRLAAELSVPADAIDEPAALARAIAAALRAAGERLPPVVDELSRPDAPRIAMSTFAEELADPDLTAPRIPGWLPTAGVAFIIAGMLLALWVGRHSLGFIDPPPACDVPAGATGVAAVRFDDACHVLSWQTEDHATWIIQRDADGTPTLATKSAPQGIRELVLDDTGRIINARGGMPAGELAALAKELAVMLPPRPAP
jgi:hypothetical protein